MSEDKFCDDMTFEEWCNKQDKDSLEFKIVNSIHDAYPNWDMNEIKTYAPMFMSTYTKIIQKMCADDCTLNFKEIEDRALNYVDIGIIGTRVHTQVFGESESCNDPYYMAKWTRGLNKILEILLSPSKYKTEDENGHSASHVIRFAGTRYSFRSERQLDRDIHKIIDHHPDRFETKSDFLRELIFKGVEIYTLVHRDSLGPIADEIMTRVKDYRLHYEDEELQTHIKAIEDIFYRKRERLERLIRHKSSDEALKEFRDEIVEYVNDVLSRPCKMQDKEELKAAVMENRDLEKILDRLEELELVGTEYVDSILDKGVPISHLSIVQKDDTKHQKRRRR